jgi:hypothetical protein
MSRNRIALTVVDLPVPGLPKRTRLGLETISSSTQPIGSTQNPEPVRVSTPSAAPVGGRGSPPTNGKIPPISAVEAR